jgi:voltage-gated potassium channel
VTQSPPSKEQVKARTLIEISPSQRRRALIRALITMIVTFFAIIGMYFIIPLRARELGAGSILLLTLAGVAFLVVLAWQVREIFRAEMPGLRAVQAVVVAAPLFLTGYAALYLILSESSGGFNEQLTRTSALYFTVVVFSSVGFGDIVPTTDLNRLLVTSQMLAGLIFVAIVARLFFGASKMSLQRRRSNSNESAGRNSHHDGLVDSDQVVEET